RWLILTAWHATVCQMARSPGLGRLFNAVPVVPPPANIRRPSGTEESFPTSGRKKVFRLVTNPVECAPRGETYAPRITQQTDRAARPASTGSRRPARSDSG